MKVDENGNQEILIISCCTVIDYIANYYEFYYYIL